MERNQHTQSSGRVRSNGDTFRSRRESPAMGRRRLGSIWDRRLGVAAAYISEAGSGPPFPFGEPFYARAHWV